MANARFLLMDSQRTWLFVYLALFMRCETSSRSIRDQFETSLRPVRDQSETSPRPPRRQEKCLRPRRGGGRNFFLYHFTLVGIRRHIALPRPIQVTQWRSQRPSQDGTLFQSHPFWAVFAPFCTVFAPFRTIFAPCCAVSDRSESFSDHFER